MTEEQNRALKATDTAKRTLVSTIGEQVEKMADAVFATVNSNRQQIADNYVSLKAYAVAAADALEDSQKKKGSRNLAAVGDLVKSVAALSDIPAGEAEGVGAGADEIPQVFSGKKLKVANPVNKINFMVNEYVGVLSECKQRWPLGLGKYLLSRIDLNMQKKGILEVDKIEGKLGNFVFINAHSVGLSSKLPEFEKLAVKMHTYQGILKKLTAKAVKMPGAGKGKVFLPLCAHRVTEKASGGAVRRHRSQARLRCGTVRLRCGTARLRRVEGHGRHGRQRQRRCSVTCCRHRAQVCTPRCQAFDDQRARLGARAGEPERGRHDDWKCWD